MVRYKKNHHDQTHKAIVDAASTLLREKGFTETSVTIVMKAVGLTHGGFYAHFDDKTAMLTAAMQEAFLQSPKNFKSLAEMATSQNDVGLIAKHYLSDSKVQNVASGCPAAALISELPRQEVEVKEAFQQGTIETMLELAKAPGLSKDSWAALSMLIGGLTLMRALPDPMTSTTIRTQIMDALRKLATEEQQE
jgi:TetR/AcrR family transcriptional regulator, transcriptional repressor for nem operon